MEQFDNGELWYRRVMAEHYLSELRSIVARSPSSRDFECKHFFSGAAAYVHGHIFT